MDVYYLAHPVSPIGDETVESNIAEAERWLVALQRANPHVAIIAPWIQEIRLGIGEESNPGHRQLGLQRCYAVAATRGLTGIVITGPRIGRGSLGELLAMAERAPVVHRFKWHDQDYTFPDSSVSILTPLHSFGLNLLFIPSWLTRCRFGSTPRVPANLVVAEIMAAIDEHGDYDQ